MYKGISPLYIIFKKSFLYLRLLQFPLSLTITILIVIKMKTIFTTYQTIFFLFFGSVMIAQTYTNENSNGGIDVFQNKATQLSFLSFQERLSSTSPGASGNNAIYIQQIGNYNDVYSNTKSINSNINLIQKGNNNEILLNLKAVSINENVLQTGVNNNFANLSTSGNISHSAAVMQRGANQNLIMLGSNSISDNMIILMQGKGQTILVRNIK